MAKKAQEKSKVSPLMRVWFPHHLLVPRDNDEGGEPKYGITCVATPTAMDAQDKALWTDMVTSANELCVNKTGKTISEYREEKEGFKMPWHSGKTKMDYGMTDKDVYINFSSRYQPVQAGPDTLTIESPLQNYLYAGCYVRMTTNPYWFGGKSAKGKTISPGIGFGVFSVMFCKDGPHLNFRSKPEEDFAAYKQQGGTAGKELTDADMGL